LKPWRVAGAAICQFTDDKGGSFAILLDQFQRAPHEDVIAWRAREHHDEAFHDSAPTLDAVTKSAASALVRRATGRAD
jgi:hypothetical protein